MKQTEIRRGATYAIRFHDGRLTPVTVLYEMRREHRGAYNRLEIVGSHTGYRCRNEATGREIVVKSATKFRFELERSQVDFKWRPVNARAHEAIAS